ncbi:MAG TPA: type II secretion system F family protein [archaeon]|nr:type II secretion system F family protein [archaeon]
MQYALIKKITEQLEKDLAVLGHALSVKDYFLQCTKKSTLIFVILFLLCKVFLGFLFSFLLSFSAAVLCFMYFMGTPAMVLAKSARRIEKHLPFALMQLSVLLNCSVPMDRALFALSNSSYGEFSKKLNEALIRCQKSAISLPNALMDVANSTRSPQFRRAISQIISVYEHGYGKSPGMDIRQMALESLLLQKAAMREFSSKLVMLSVVFIAISAIVPALFQSFVLVGSTFMEIPFDSFQLLLIVCILFPLLDCLILLSMRSLTPEFLRENT